MWSRFRVNVRGATSERVFAVSVWECKVECGFSFAFANLCVPEGAQRPTETQIPESQTLPVPQATSPIRLGGWLPRALRRPHTWAVI